MHIGEILKADCANGTGMRVSLFVSGCKNHCPGCFQPETWDFHYGQKWTPELEQNLISELKKPYYEGLTILGGDPMELENQPDVAMLIEHLKTECPDKTIWIYTGYDLEKDLAPHGKRYGEYTDKILDHIDVLVDGRYEEAKKDVSLAFRGSANQRVIDVQATRNGGKLHLLFEK